MTEEHTARIDKYKEWKKAHALRTACSTCISDGFQLSCDGKIGRKACSRCKKTDKDCRFPDDAINELPMNRRAHTVNAAKALEAQGFDVFRRWQTTLQRSEEDVLQNAVRECEPTPIDEGKPYFLTIYNKRMSSGPDDGILGPRFQDLVQQIPLDHQRYNNYLNSPNPNQDPEGIRPTGPGQAFLQMQGYGNIFVRHGTAVVPTQLSLGLSPHLAGFVRLLHRITAQGPGVHRPEELHFLTWGVAGLSTDINAFGSRRQPAGLGQNVGDGLIGYLLQTDRQNGTTLADRTYLITLANKSVVDGLTNVSIEGAGQDLTIQYFVHHLRKFLFKNKILDLVDRKSGLLLSQ